MPLDLAKKIILKEFEYVERSEINDALKIDLFGGEPLLNFKFIKEFSEWLWQQDIKIPYIIYATTNGTLLDVDKQVWFREHKDDIVLVMSVDGDSGMQLENRGCDVRKLPIEFAHELWPDQPFKMTISKNTVRDLSRGVISLVKKGYLVESRLAQGESWEATDADIYREELVKLARFYLDNPRYEPNSLFMRFYGDVLIDQAPLKFCGSGTNMIAYGVDGKTYPCHMFSPVVLGRDVSEALRHVDFNTTNELVEESCKTCKMLRVCPTCIGFNYLKRGDVGKRDKLMCRLLKEEAYVASAFQIEYYMKKKDMLSEEEKVKLKAALKTYELVQDCTFES